MRTYEIDSDVILTYPNAMSFTNSRYQYVMVDHGSTLVNTTDFDVLHVNYKKNTVILKRAVLGQKVIFPLTSVLESLARMTGENVLRNINIVCITDAGIAGVDLECVVVGSYDSEIKANIITGQSGVTLRDRVILYPEFICNVAKTSTQQMWFPANIVDDPASLSLSVRLMEYIGDHTFAFLDTIEWDTKKKVSDYIPIFDLPLEKFLDTPISRGYIGISSSLTFNYLRQDISVDYCTDGVFLKWLDKSGIPRLYRWSLESTEEESDVEETYTCLDEMLQPYEEQDRTLTTRYVLHSRMVEQDIYDLCKSILGGRELFMWNSDLKDWERCYLDDSDAEDTGDILKDLTIEVLKKEYHI